MSNIETNAPEPSPFTGVKTPISPFTGEFVPASEIISEKDYNQELGGAMLSATEKEIEKFYTDNQNNVLANEDLLAAGFAQDDIDGYERKLQARGSNISVATDHVMQTQGYPSDIWDAFDTYEDATNYWNNIVLKDPNVTPPMGVLGYGWYTDPITNKRSYITTRTIRRPA